MIHTTSCNMSRLATATAAAALSTFATLVPISASTAASRPLATPTPPIPGYHLVFSDDFSIDNRSPDHTGNYNWFEGYWFNANHAPNGNLSWTKNKMSLSWTRDQNEKVSNTSISTFSKVSKYRRFWQFGYFEVRMRWSPIAIGAWPAIWLAAKEHATGEDIYNVSESGIKFGEIDIYETIYEDERKGDWPRVFHGSVWDWRGDPSLPFRNNEPAMGTTYLKDYVLPRGTDLTKFHTYALLWERGHLSWYFDGRKLFSSPSNPILDMQHYYLIIGMQEGLPEGNDWKPGKLPESAPDKLTMDVAWVRVWKKN